MPLSSIPTYQTSSDPGVGLSPTELRAEILQEAANRVLRVRMPRDSDGPVLLLEVLEAAARAVVRA